MNDELEIGDLPQLRPLRRVDRIERDSARPGWARLHLACGHAEELEDFPPGQPPPCFRRICPVPGCCNA